MILSNEHIVYVWLWISFEVQNCSLILFIKRYAHDEETADDQEETGWKFINGDVFRYPKYKSLFAAALGSGTQLFTL